MKPVQFDRVNIKNCMRQKTKNVHAPVVSEHSSCYVYADIYYQDLVIFLAVPSPNHSIM